MASQKKERLHCKSSSLDTDSMSGEQQGVPPKDEYEEDSSDEEVGPRVKWHKLC